MMNTLGELGFADCHGANRNLLVVTALRFPDSIAQASLVRDPRRQARYRLACAGVFPLSFSFLRVLSGAFQTDNSVWPKAYPFRVVPNYAPGDRPWGVIRASRRCAIDDPGMKQAPRSLDRPVDLATPISAPAVTGGDVPGGPPSSVPQEQSAPVAVVMGPLILAELVPSNEFTAFDPARFTRRIPYRRA